MKKQSIVFVCLGNYCRSPMAEAIFSSLLQADGLADKFEVSSAGTKNWDVGLPPDPRTKQVLNQHGYPLRADKRAQMITQEEIKEADYLIAMSQRVADDLGNGSNVHLLLDFAPEIGSKDVPDPYPTNTFPQAFRLIEHGVKTFYQHVKGSTFN